MNVYQLFTNDRDQYFVVAENMESAIIKLKGHIRRKTDDVYNREEEEDGETHVPQERRRYAEVKHADFQFSAEFLLA
ncbi:hypothetical protein LCGC14_0651570 [marine sediment metagenome]|uniref:Uncharacterized protein n=1 Tax=marine sediment metagenome TaxID=412755 RepID=A0A0F9QW35_9ZZZZ